MTTTTEPKATTGSESCNSMYANVNEALLQLINLAMHTTHNNSYHTETGLWNDCAQEANWIGGYAFTAVCVGDLAKGLRLLTKCAALEAKQPRIKNRRFETARNAVQEALNSQAASTVYLQVPFKEKDQAKALGARFDGERKQWFVPHGISPNAFAQWIANS